MSKPPSALACTLLRAGRAGTSLETTLHCARRRTVNILSLRNSLFETLALGTFTLLLPVNHSKPVACVLKISLLTRCGGAAAASYMQSERGLCFESDSGSRNVSNIHISNLTHSSCTISVHRDFEREEVHPSSQDQEL